MTSHDVVARIRRLAGTRRVGHAGTLDPMATGVLVLGIGRATRLLGHLAADDKEYSATIHLGVRTVTDDAEGEVLARADPASVTDESLLTAVHALTGNILQVPSAVSAVKVGGVRAYARVRAGEQVELAPRPVTVSRFEIVGRSGALLDVAVECSTGTYVRALARDLGEALGVGAHLSALRRTRAGAFALAQARTLDELADRGLAVTPLGEAVSVAFPRRDVGAEEAAGLRHGRPPSPSGRAGPVGVFDAETGEVLALVEDRDGIARPLVVFVG
jgi:tRNA pseudouridine55 synthase